MSKNIRWLAGGLVLAFVAALRADNAGQADLDQATELQVVAKTLADLEKVVKLTESAISKGLDKDNQEFAKQMLASTLYQHAARLCVPIFEQNPPSPRWPLLRQFALQDLEKAARNADLPDVHLLIAKLNALPKGDPKRALEAADAAVKGFKDDRKQSVAAILLRAALQTEEEKRLADYEQAIRLDPMNADAWTARASYFVLKGNLEKAIDDFNKLLENDRENVVAHQALAEVLTNLKKYDQAVEHVNKAIELQPDSYVGYRLRARIRGIQNDSKGALEDLSKALEIEPKDIGTMLMRARLHLADENIKAAKGDIEKVLQIQPGLVQGILLRSIIHASEENYVDAISDLQAVLKADPKNPEFLMQLARYYQADHRPRKAIATLDMVIEEDKENWSALRMRGDALLGIGKHKEAIADFNTALAAQPENSGLLNNLAWVLATSPDDKVRNAKRAIELATKACEVTKYQEAHILSTLAAAFAEAGDFETAMKWSTKSVELGRQADKQQGEQLEKELESYKQKKPWRELQQQEEKPEPAKRPAQIFDT